MLYLCTVEIDRRCSLTYCYTGHGRQACANIIIYVCAMLGNLAACKFYEGDVVAATLRFSTHEYQGQTFQEILATDVVKVKG